MALAPRTTLTFEVAARPSGLRMMVASSEPTFSTIASSVPASVRKKVGRSPVSMV